MPSSCKVATTSCSLASSAAGLSTGGRSPSASLGGSVLAASLDEESAEHSRVSTSVLVSAGTNRCSNSHSTCIWDTCASQRSARCLSRANVVSRLMASSTVAVFIDDCSEPFTFKMASAADIKASSTSRPPVDATSSSKSSLLSSSLRQSSPASSSSSSRCSTSSALSNCALSHWILRKIVRSSFALVLFFSRATASRALEHCSSRQAIDGRARVRTRALSLHELFLMPVTVRQRSA